MAAIEKHRLNLHIPKPLFDVLESARAVHGMSYTEFANRALEQAARNYTAKGVLPPPGDV